MLALPLAFVASVSLIETDRVVLRDRHIRVGDVAAGIGSPHPGRNDPASLVIASVPEGVVVTTVSRRAIASLIARRLPGLRVDIGSATAPVRFQRPARRREQIVAAADLADRAGVGRVAPFAPPAIRKGETLRLISREGAVAIERPVTAMQAGYSARAMFVRDADGQVFAVRVAGR